MNKIHLLGSSIDTIAILFDLAVELKGADLFLIYPNSENNSVPDTPIQNINYKIMALGDFPDNDKNVFFSTAGPKNRANIFKSFLEKHNITQNRYDQYIHNTAYIASSSKIEKGVMIEPMSVISSQTNIGFGVYIKRGSLVGHHNKIGNFTDINPGVTISSNVTIGEKCTIGSGAVIKDNITIGDNTIIGIGSIVTKDIPANSIAFGNPCKVVRENK